MAPKLDGKFVARAELVLARADTEPLGDAGIKPDPLQQFARVFRALRTDLGESATVAIDLLPAKPVQRRQFRKRLVKDARRRMGNGEKGGSAAVLDEILAGGNGRGRSIDAADQVERRYNLRQLSSKMLENDAMFQPQILIRVESEIPGRAEGHLQAFISCFDSFAGQNYFKVAGLNLAGLKFFGSDATPWRRTLFDRRFETGLFRPRRKSLLLSRELAGLLKPPTKHCVAPNVVRLGGVVPPAPQSLTRFSRQRDVLPLGVVTTEAGDRLVGVPLKGSFFTYMCGRSRYGKTETAVNQFIHLARSGHGCLFLDPHEDALKRIKRHLTDPEIADRVVEINLAGRAADKRQPSWNLFSMEGLDESYKEQRTEAVVDSFESALGSKGMGNRALTLTTQAAQSLVELALALPPELAPTIFQMTTLLSSDEWREAALPFFSPPSRQFWAERFGRMPADAIIPVTNLIDRLRSSPAMAGLLGAPRSTYNVRKAMDEGKIVLCCPGSGGQKDRLMANFLVYDLLHAARSRVDTPPEERREFHVFLDEVQTYDGASSGNLAALLEQTGKYGIRAYLLNQDPDRLTERTLAALMTNRSHLLSTAVSARAASLLSKEWGGEPTAATVQALQRYTYLAEVTIGGDRAKPFLVRGASVDQMWSDVANEDGLPVLDDAIDRNTERRPTEDVIRELDDHDVRIFEALQKLTAGERRGIDRIPAAAQAHSGPGPDPEVVDQEPPGSLTFELPGSES